MQRAKPVAKKADGQAVGQDASEDAKAHVRVDRADVTDGSAKSATSRLQGGHWTNGSLANGASAGVASKGGGAANVASVKGHSNGHARDGHAGHGDAGDAHANNYDEMLERAGAKLNPADGSVASGGRSEQFAGFQTDAPSCDGCGSITVRNGNCYLCHNCGNSMGCS